jgi:hypothetical protein
MDHEFIPNDEWHNNDSHSATDEINVQTLSPATTTIRPQPSRKLRKSCGRCHAQKLRCVRDPAFPTRCKRCHNAGLECVFSARASKPSVATAMSGASSFNDCLGLEASTFAMPNLNDLCPDVSSLWPGSHIATPSESSLPTGSSSSLAPTSASSQWNHSQSSRQTAHDSMIISSDSAGNLESAFSALEMILRHLAEDPEVSADCE